MRRFEVPSRYGVLLTGCFLLNVLVISPLHAGQGEDSPAVQLLDPDHFHWTPPSPDVLTRSWWESRREVLREKLLISAGLVPEPPRAPLNARIFGEVEGTGFRVSKVYFESLPGFLVTGNLYRPTNSSPPYPAILTPHGHWRFGRLQNAPEGSVPARCIDFARQGYVVFSYDMVGYNDSFQLPHDNLKSRAQVVADQPLPYEPRLFRGTFDFPLARLYGLSLGGLQLWNSIRALDFLASLEEVDPERLGVTGASGGATQTLLLMAADDRVKVAAPVNIIGMEKQPGCRCENIPNLWIGTSTLELAAVFAPKPLILISATRDPWTHSTPTREYPTLLRYYHLYGADAHLANHHVDAAHNYNAESRRAVYDWFRRYLDPSGPPVSDPPPVAEEMASLGDLRVFPDHLLPETARSVEQILSDWEESSEGMIEKEWPASPDDYPTFATRFRRLFSNLLSADVSEAGPRRRSTEVVGLRGNFSYRLEKVVASDRNSFRLESIRRNGETRGAVLLIYPESFGSLAADGSRTAFPMIDLLASRGFEIFHVRGFASHERAIPDRRWSLLNWPEAYNRDDHLRAVEEIVSALGTIRDEYPEGELIVIGLDSKGLETAFAAAVSGLADRAVIDLRREDPEVGDTLLRLFPIAGIRKIGDFRTAGLLLADHKLSLLNPGQTFPANSYRERVERAGKGQNLAIYADIDLTAPDFVRVLED